MLASAYAQPGFSEMEVARHPPKAPPISVYRATSHAWFPKALFTIGPFLIYLKLALSHRLINVPLEIESKLQSACQTEQDFSRLSVYTLGFRLFWTISVFVNNPIS